MPRTPHLPIAAAVLAFIAAAAPALSQAAIADLRPGLDVTLTGVVERITDDDEFLLRDATGTITVYVGPNRVPAVAGETVIVTGSVDDDGPLEIYARVIIRADGTRVDLPQDD